MKKNKKQNNIYFWYLFSNFLRKPMSYISIGVYFLYLIIILLIVPAAMHQNPLFIWTNASFGITIFNLIFISLWCAILAVLIFRDSIEDGMEIIIMSKPLNRTRFIAIKFLFFISIVVMINIVSILIVCFTMCFGVYDYWANPTGISVANFFSLIGSITIGNTVCAAFFGSIAILISLNGGKVAIMVGTLLTSFCFSLINFVLPEIATDAETYLKNTYDADMDSFVYNITDENFDSSLYYVAGLDSDELDSCEAWEEACTKSMTTLVNTFDFGGQLASLFNLFSLQSNSLDSAWDSEIGDISSYKYTLNNGTKVVGDSYDAEQSNLYPTIGLTATYKEGIVSYSAKMIGSSNLGLMFYNVFYGFPTDTILFFEVDGKTMNDSAFTSLIPNCESNIFNAKQLLLDNVQGIQTLFDDFYDTVFDLYLGAVKNNSYIDGSQIHGLFNDFYDDYANIVYKDSYEAISVQQKMNIIAKTKYNFWTKTCATFFLDEQFGFGFKSEAELREIYYNEADDAHYTLTAAIEMFDELCVNQKHGVYDIECPTRFSQQCILTPTIVSKDLTINQLHNFYTYSIEPYASESGIASAWIFMSIIIYGLAIVIYSKTDIK